MKAKLPTPLAIPKPMSAPEKISSSEFHFCDGCGNIVGYRSLKLDDDGKRKVAVNVRLAPELVLDQCIDHFDGLNTFEDLPNKPDEITRILIQYLSKMAFWTARLAKLDAKPFKMLAYGAS